MEIADLKQEALALLEANQIKSLINFLVENVEDDRHKKNTVLLLSSRFVGMEDNFNAKLINRETYNRESNQIKHALLLFIEDLRGSVEAQDESVEDFEQSRFLEWKYRLNYFWEETMESNRPIVILLFLILIVLLYIAFFR